MKITHHPNGAIVFNWGTDEFNEFVDTHPACARGNGLSPTIELRPGHEPVYRLSWYSIPQADPMDRIEQWAWDLLVQQAQNELVAPVGRHHNTPKT
jgi:hypothetical protein